MRDLTAAAGAAWASLTPPVIAVPAEQRFNPNHDALGEFAAAGGSAGAQGAASGQPAGQTRNTKAKNAQRKTALLHQASQDRAQAHKLEQQLHQVDHMIAAAAKAAKAAHANPARSAAAKKAAAHRTTHKGPKGAPRKSLHQQAAQLKQRITTLLSQARKLDQQAAKL